MDASTSSRRRRTNLQLNLAPLHSISASADGPPSAARNDDEFTPNSSYIAGKSAPTTPGILARTASGRNLNSRSYTHLAFADMADSALIKSRSSAGLSDGGRRVKKKSDKQKRDDEWFYRAGAAIAGETREYKGQQWLATRQSSTSLVALGDEDDTRESLKRSAGNDSLKSGKNSRSGSARQSRRGSQASSRTTSRVDLTAMTPTWRSAEDAMDYFAHAKGNRGFDGPDFVDGEEEEDNDAIDTGREEDDDDESRDEDDEIARLATYRGFGLGGLVDRLIGWSLFEVPDAEEEEDEAAASSSTVAHPNSIQTLPAPTAPVVSPDALRGNSTEKGNSSNTFAAQQGQGWKDAAWLLSVASKVIF